MSRETREKLSGLGDQIFETELKDKADLYRHLEKTIVNDEKKKRKQRKRQTFGRIVLGAACLVAAMFLGATLLADTPAVRAVLSGFEQAKARVADDSGIQIYDSLETLSAEKHLTLPNLTYLPKGFILQDGVRYQEYAGRPVINFSYVKSDRDGDYLSVSIVTASDYGAAGFDMSTYSILEESQDKISILSDTAPYGGEIYIGEYVYLFAGSLSKDEMKRVAEGVVWPA